jgi:hypothetical protein
MQHTLQGILQSFDSQTETHKDCNYYTVFFIAIHELHSYRGKTESQNRSPWFCEHPQFECITEDE